MLLMEGVPFKVVSARAGHSTVGITLNTYWNLLPGADEQAATRLDDLMGPNIAASAERGPSNRNMSAECRQTQLLGRSPPPS